MARNTIDISKMIDTDYINQIKDELTAEMLLDGKTLSLIHTIPNIPNKITLNDLDVTINPVTDACGWDADEGVSLSQKVLEVTHKTVMQHICEKELLNLYQSEFMSGSNNNIPFADLLIRVYTNKVNNWIEKSLWRGFDDKPGFLQILMDDTDTKNASQEVETATSSIEKVNAMIAKCSPELLEHEGKILFVPYAFYNDYMNELRKTNLYINSNYVNGNYETTIVGTDIKMVALYALDNYSVAEGVPMVLTYGDNLVYGTYYDGSDVDLWYEKGAKEWRVNIEMSLGMQVRYGDMAVIGYTLPSLS